MHPGNLAQSRTPSPPSAASRSWWRSFCAVKYMQTPPSTYASTISPSDSFQTKPSVLKRCEWRDIGQTVQNQVPVRQRALEADLPPPREFGAHRGHRGDGTCTRTSTPCTAVLSPMSLLCPGFNTLTFACVAIGREPSALVRQCDAARQLIGDPDLQLKPPAAVVHERGIAVRQAAARRRPQGAARCSPAQAARGFAAHCRNSY